MVLFSFHLSLQGHLLLNTSILSKTPEVKLSHHGHITFLCYVMSGYACPTVDLLLVIRVLPLCWDLDSLKCWQQNLLTTEFKLPIRHTPRYHNLFILSACAVFLAILFFAVHDGVNG